MSLATALADAARVAVAERENYCNDAGCVSEDLFPETDTRAFEIVYRGSPSACELFIQSRVNAAVFAWWFNNWRNVELLVGADHDFGTDGVFHSLASGEAS